jgi:enoyl-CoA hydratase
VLSATRTDCYSLEITGNVAVLSLDRPPVNALSHSNYAELASFFESLGAMDGPDVVLVRSAQERAFCAGADIREAPEASPLDNAERQRLTRRLFTSVRRCPVPVIASVNAAALGAGFALAASCDIRVAGPRATFGLPEINVGKGGGGRHAMYLAPPGIVRLLYFTGRPLDVGQAQAANIVDIRVDDEARLDEVARALAQEIAGKSPLALRLGKEALLLAEDLGVEEGYRAEQQFSMRLAMTDDGAEAAKAFLEKRPPVWARS